MKKILITFGGSVYDSVTKKIVANGPRMGADEVWVYDDAWLMRQDFYAQNKWLWEHHHKRGFGWYAWKPFIILDALARLEDGDIVMFTDADTYPIADFSLLFDTCRKEGGIMLFRTSGSDNREWCKRDCLIVMGQDDEKYRTGTHGVARYMLFEKGKWRPQQFLMEWLTYSVNPRANTFDPSILGPELPGFKEHRCEQAIMTLLSYKYGYKLHREICDAGEGYPKDADLYGMLFIQENPWNDKNGKNITAPVEGSRYANIPEKKEAVPAGAAGTASYRTSPGTKALSLWSRAAYNAKKKGREIAFRITPRSAKDYFKKKLESRKKDAA